MTNSKELFRDLVAKVILPESRDEIEAIIYMLMENRLGVDRQAILSEKKIKANPVELDSFIDRINQQEPIQYILGKAVFFGRTFNVNPSVLIPRPETELLISEIKGLNSNTPSIMDVGTGCGCIAITLALEINGSKVIAIDISEAALTVAKENALKYNASINFQLLDILSQNLKIRELDILVSNPPYITESEKALMSKNVLEYEPSIALFVSDSDPLQFYRAIAQQGLTVLKEGGLLITELNEKFGRETASLFSQLGYRTIGILKDLDGKDRVIAATR